MNGESGLTRFDCISYGLELDRAHGKYLWHESVELIEATPRSRGGETLENPSHTLVIHLIGAVEYVDSLTESGGKILGGFSFTSSGRSSWCTTHLQVKSLGGCDVNSIGKRSNNESGSISEVFITIVKASIGNSEDEVISAWVKDTLQLSLPLELI